MKLHYYYSYHQSTKIPKMANTRSLSLASISTNSTSHAGQLPNVISMLHLTTSQRSLRAIHFINSHSDSILGARNKKSLGRRNSQSLMVTQIVNMRFDRTFSKPGALAFILSPEVNIVSPSTNSRVPCLDPFVKTFERFWSISVQQTVSVVTFSKCHNEWHV